MYLFKAYTGKMVFPDFKFEKELWKNEFSIIGVDEVGRGAFAGPLCVGGVIFKTKSLKAQKYLMSLGINDSKKLSSNKRFELSQVIKEISFFATSFIDVSVINKIGIGKATYLGMQNVVKGLSTKVSNPFVLVDAFTIPNILQPQKGIIHGDSLSISIAAASIIAKVARDTLMQKLSKDFKNYDWDNNKGYGTLKHRQAISKFGMSKYHRVDFCRRIVITL